MLLPDTDDGDLHPRGSQASGRDAEAQLRTVPRATPVLHDETRVLIPRSSGSSTCLPGNDSPICAKPTDSTNTQTLPIVLGVVIPISVALVIFIFLHRRNKKRQALEDINDPHKSLDFGLGIDGPLPDGAKPRGGFRGKRNNAPEMIVTDLDDSTSTRFGHSKTRGLSMDMLGSPYMLPAGLSGSRESLHSMSRSVRDEHDPYRPVTFVRGSSDTSRSPRPFRDNASMYSASTTHTGYNEKSQLTVNAQRMSQSYPPPRSRATTKGSEDVLPSDPALETLTVTISRQETSRSTTPQPAVASPRSKEPVVATEPVATLPPPEEKTQEDFTSFDFNSGAAAEPRRPPRTSSVYAAAPPRKSSMVMDALSPPTNRPFSESSNYGEDPLPPPPPPPAPEKQHHPEIQFDVSQTDNAQHHGDFDYVEDLGYDIDPNMIYTGRHSIDGDMPSQELPPQGSRRSHLGVRPLPLEDPQENAEQRANRIRSFYKEYFDVNKPTPANAYYEDFDSDYMYADQHADMGWYDPDTGAYYDAAPPQMPYAQPMGRRAMTPPPRSGPRFAGAHPHDRHFSTASGGGRGQFRGRPPPKKKLPPPKPLQSLPTPHMLKSDSALLNGIDFAPPTSFRETQNGRGRDSPTGTPRPFSPGVRAFSPLVSSYDNLAPIPSPHNLRKSGTFTSLDFSPQVPRFLGRDGAGSDAGSIRSARSGISALQQGAVRSGAYRVSRIPKEFVTSREDLSKQLRPKMDLVSRA